MKWIQRFWLAAACILWCAIRVEAQNWMETSAPSNYWTSVASSADGATLVACSALDGDGLIYVSTNSGATWTQASAPAKNWVSMASSADGATLLAAVAYYGPGGIWRSGDGGSTWVQTSAPDTNGYACLACSADGTKLVAASPAGGHYDGWLFTSTDGGAFWTGADLYPEVWASVAPSADGQRWIAVSEYGAWAMYTSTDFGQTWLRPSNPPSRHWASIASSADGMRFVAATRGAIFLSTNSGAAWVASGAPELDWAGVASSADGANLVAIAENQPIYRSTDSGATWQAMPSPATNWEGIASSADGSKLTAVVRGGGIYTWQTAPTPVLKITASGQSLVLSWTVPSMEFVVQENAGLNAANWKDVAAERALNYTNLHYEATIPAPTSYKSYRLAR